MADVKKRVVRQIVTPWQTSFRPSWTLKQITAALREHRMGSLNSTAQLVDSFNEDDEIPGTLDRRVKSLLKCSMAWDGEPAPELEKHWRYMIGLDDGEAADFIRLKHLLGISIGTVRWEKTDNLYVPYLKTMPLQFAYYDWDKACWKYQCKEGLFDVEPGNGTWVTMTEGQQGWLKGYVRPLSFLWGNKSLTLRDWNRYNERHGLPIVKAIVPVTVDSGEPDEFVDELRTLGTEGVIGLPQDQATKATIYDLELLEPSDQSWDSFQALIDRQDRKVKVLLIGGNLVSEVSTTGANRAAVETMSQNLDSTLAYDDAQLFSCVLYEQIVKPFYLVNGMNPDKAPRPVFDTTPIAERATKIAAQQQFATMIGAMRTAGLEVKNVDQIAAQLGLEVKQVPLPKPEAPGKKLASGDGVTPGLQQGQDTIDGIGDALVSEASDAIQPDMKTLIRLVSGSTSYDDLRTRARTAFEKADPSKLAAIIDKAMLVAELTGRYSVLKDAVS